MSMPKDTNIYDLRVIALGLPLTGSLELDWIGKQKLKNRKVLRIDEVLNILRGISVNVTFKRIDERTDKMIGTDTLTFGLSDKYLTKLTDHKEI